jgi:2-amino-4-hydroxy-6-hydroxymethyldihydropteridine diphosphokinase
MAMSAPPEDGSLADHTPVAPVDNGDDMRVPTVFLGLGSNLGDREAAIAGAVARLGERGFRTTLRSSLWLSEPVGGPPQGMFLNAVAGGETELGPEALLEACLATEREMGRVRGERNGPRTIDVDILLYGSERRDAPGLVIPHPRLHERRFVLAPLAEVAPGAVHPVLGKTAAELLARCPDPSFVRLHAPAEARG